MHNRQGDILRLYRIILDTVGATLAVARGRFPHNKTSPLHADISTPRRVAGATIGRPQTGRRRFPRKTGMIENHCIMPGCVPTVSIKEYRRSRAKAFSRGEGGTLPVMAVILLY